MALAALTTAQLAALDTALGGSADKLVALGWRCLRQHAPAAAPQGGVDLLAETVANSRDAVARAAWAAATGAALAPAPPPPRETYAFTGPELAELAAEAAEATAFRLPYEPVKTTSKPGLFVVLEGAAPYLVNSHARDDVLAVFPVEDAVPSNDTTDDLVVELPLKRQTLRALARPGSVLTLNVATLEVEVTLASGKRKRA